MNTVLLGLQWGDEGKGKLVDYLSDEFDVVCRYQGGANAGHTVYYGDKEISLHLVPSGIFHKDKINVIGNGTVIDIEQLERELTELHNLNINFNKRFFISRRAHIIKPSHFKEEKSIKKEIGTTGKGIGPAYSEKCRRTGMRIGDIFSDEYIKNKKLPRNFSSKILKFREKYGKYVTDTVDLLNNLNRQNKRILFEGAQGVLLDIDFGTYPYVTSSNPVTGGVCTGSGISPLSISDIIGVHKVYTTRVGKGPFPTEMNDENQTVIREKGDEYGATTGRPRRCGWLDLVALRYSVMITGTTSLALTKIDVLDGFDEVKVAVEYSNNGRKTQKFPSEIWKFKDVKPIYRKFKGWTQTHGLKQFNKLPEEAIEYIRFIEDFVGVKVSLISTGMKRGDLISV